jgi:hypothetical protein
VIAFAALWLSLAAFTVIVSDVTIFRLLGNDGVRYSHVIKICRYTNMLAHSRVYNSLQGKSQTLMVSTGSFTTISASRAQQSKGHNIPYISRIPIWEGKFLSKKCNLCTRKYGIADDNPTTELAVSALSPQQFLCNVYIADLQFDTTGISLHHVIYDMITESME